VTRQILWGGWSHLGKQDDNCQSLPSAKRGSSLTLSLANHDASLPGRVFSSICIRFAQRLGFNPAQKARVENAAVPHRSC